MQRLLWTITALTLLLVAAIMIVPRFIDWNAYRDEIAAAAERATGRQVTISGDVHLLLLPTPALSAAQVRIGNPPGFGDQPFAEIKSLDARFSFWPLLLGRVEIESVALIEPRLTLLERPDGSFNWRIDREIGEDVSFDRLIVVGGTVAWMGAHPDRITQIDAELVDQPLASGIGAGWRISGDAEFHALVWQGTLSLGAPGSAGRSANASIGLRGGAASLRFAGTLAGDSWQGAHFAGKLTGAASRLPVLLRLFGVATPEALTAPATIEANLSGDAHGLALDDVAVTSGDLRLAGRVALGIDPALRLDAKLAANRIDLARWLKPAPPGPEAVVQPIAALAASGMPDGTLSLVIDAITWRDGIIRDVKLDGHGEAGSLAIQQATAQLPGGSDLTLFGRLDPGWHFAGRLEAGSDNLRGLFTWLGLDVAAIPADRLRRVAVTASLQSAPERIDIGDLDLSFDSSKLTGEIGFSRGDRAGLTADLTIDQINLDPYLASARAGLEGAAQGATDLALRLHADQLTWRGLPIGDASVAITFSRGNFDTAAHIADFAGGRLQLGASWARAAPDGHADAVLRLAMPEAARLAPLLAADAALPSLGAADLKFDLHGPAKHPQVKLAMALAGATLDAEGSAGFDGEPASISVAVDHPAALALLQRFFPTYLPNGDAGGPLAFAGHLTWQSGIGTLEDITARIGPTNLVGKISLDLTAARPRFVASLAASSLDLGLLPAAEMLPLAHAGEDDWLAGFDVDFGLRAGAVDAGSLSFGDVAAIGSLRRKVLDLSDLSASWLGGALTGSAKAELGAAPSLALDIALKQGEIGQAGALLFGDPDPQGRFDLAARVAGAGSDLASLVGALAGDGSFHAGPGTIDGFDLDAAAELLAKPAPVGSLLPEVTKRLAGGATRFAGAEGKITVADGGVRGMSGRVALAAPAPPIEISADLAHDRVEIKPADAHEGARLVVSGAIAAQTAAAGSPAATKIYDVLPIASP